MKIVIVTIKSWNIRNAEKLKIRYQNEHDIKIITEKEKFTVEMLDNFRPDYVFLPHWSHIIPAEIYENYECVVFHMTDLPYGRGGSPLQNLIVRGHKETRISAIRVEKEIDGGPVYAKEKLSLEGSATEIFERASSVIFDQMIPAFWKNKMEPVRQQGTPTYFKRRTPKDCELRADMKLEELYDYIRMLDAEGYPKAFMHFGEYKLTFTNANLNGDELTADVKIIRRHD